MDRQLNNMFHVMEEILLANQYEKINIKAYLNHFFQEIYAYNMRIIDYALFKSGKKSVHYILLIDIGNEMLSVEEILEMQLGIYENLIRSNSELMPDFDKNVSLLLCMNMDVLNEELERKVLLLEEDPYCFKKLVLTYTDDDIMKFKENAVECGTWLYIQSVINQLKMKGINDFKDKDVLFVLRILIKLPFLPVDIVMEGETEDLFSIMEKDMSSEKLNIWKLVKKGTEEEIKSWKIFDTNND